MTSQKLFEVACLDMDGVACDFARAAFMVHDKHYSHKDVTWGFYEQWGIKEADFWRKIDAAGYLFWRDLEPYPWLGELISVARELADTVKVLTAPWKSAECYKGKYLWWKRYIPEDIEFVPFKSKQLLASPRRLLIDDGDHNIEAWQAAGGKAVTFPQPWNKMREAMDRPMYEVGRQVELLRREIEGEQMIQKAPTNSDLVFEPRFTPPPKVNAANYFKFQNQITPGFQLPPGAPLLDEPGEVTIIGPPQSMEFLPCNKCGRPHVPHQPCPPVEIQAPAESGPLDAAAAVAFSEMAGDIGARDNEIVTQEFIEKPLNAQDYFTFPAAQPKPAIAGGEACQ